MMVARQPVRSFCPILEMNSPPQQTTLRDLVGVFRAHRLLFSVVVLVAIASSVGYSLSQTPEYTARASVGFQDPSRDLGLVGLGVTPTQTAAQLAAANVPTISESDVVSAVRRSIRSRASNAELVQSVSATVDPGSTLVVIRAVARTGLDAQRLANAFARASASAANSEARASFRAAVRQLRRARPKRQDPNSKALYDSQIVRLQTLGVIAKPARVAELARRPATPTSPRPLRNALLGAALGLILGLLAVFARDSLDRRLRTVADIQGELDMPLLGHVRDDAMGRSPNPEGAGGVSSENWELFRMVRRNLDFLDTSSALRTVAITSSIPEEGKTTVAMFLAFASAAAGKRTLLIECDLRRPVFASRLGVQQSPGLTDFVTGDAGPQDILQRVSFSDPASRNGYGPHEGDVPLEREYVHELVCISAGTRTQHPVEVLGSDRFKAMLTEVQDAYDVVILDTPPLLSVVDALELVPHVTATILCVRAARTTRDQARAGMAALERLPDRPVGLVVTGTRRDEEPVYGYYGYYGY